jgi:dTDP-4-dehydrorhamnose reductase
MSQAGFRVLITGVAGQVGGSLTTAARQAGFTVLAFGHDQFDLTDGPAMRRVLADTSPDAVVNCAAYTAVDQAENEAELAFAVNGRAPGLLAQWCAEQGRPLLHLSTDYVFGGDGTRPYREDDPIRPIGVYGASKAEGERTVRAAGGHHVILRTAWVYAAQGKNFVRTMLRLGAERDSLNVVTDQRGCPTAAPSIARALCLVLERLAKRDAVSGTFHYVDGGETTWHGFAERIFDGAAKHWGRRPTVKPITTDQYPTPARRPAYSVLDAAKFRTTFGLAAPPWEESLDEVLAEIFAPRK